MKRGHKALCKVCKNEYAYHGGTSNLRDHLVRALPSKLRPPEDQPCLNSYLSKAKCPEGRAKRITQHITDMVVRDLRPAAMVEGVGFQALSLLLRRIFGLMMLTYHLPVTLLPADGIWLPVF